MVNQGNPDLQTLRHAHKIGVAQQCIQHITARLEIGNAIDGIERKSTLQAHLLRFGGRNGRKFGGTGKNTISLVRCEQQASQKVRVQNTAVVTRQRGEFTILIVARRKSSKSRSERAANGAGKVIPQLSEAFHAWNGAEVRISGEDFVTPKTREGNLYTRTTSLARNEVCVDAVHGRQIHCSQGVRDGGQNVSLRHTDLVVIGVELRGDGAGVLRLGKIGFTKDNRERAGSNTATAQNADQRAGIDAA